MKYDLHFVYATFSSDPKAYNGRFRGGILWREGMAGPFDKSRAQSVRRQFGGEIVERTVEIALPHDEEAESASEEEAQEEAPKQTFQEAAADYTEKTSELAAAREAGTFDYMEFTGGSRKKKDIQAAYERLQEIRQERNATSGASS